MATFKDIYDDFVAGKKIRNSNWGKGIYIALINGQIVDETGEEIGVPFNYIIKFRHNWEVVEPKVEITASQFDKAWQDVLTNQSGVYGTGPFVSKAAIKKRLGL